LFVTCLDLYPWRPLFFCSIPVPYHINVSQEGRICLDYLETRYQPTYLVVELIQFVKQLFYVPDKATPVSLEKLELWKTNQDEYTRRLMLSIAEQAKSSGQAWPAGWRMKNEAPYDFKIGPCELGIPALMRSQFSGEFIPIEKQYLASSGAICHIDELRQR
jgi:hypothetical protein